MAVIRITARHSVCHQGQDTAFPFRVGPHSVPAWIQPLCSFLKGIFGFFLMGISVDI